jgi:RNA polymerase sigma factor (sigma-70 family)
MASTTLGQVLGYLRTTCAAERARDLTDAELLERFLKDGEEAAFTLVLQRHGPMVLAVCRRVLGDVHASEDCFQATFLVLARRATSIHKHHSLASWLHGVARRIALRARAQTAARRQRERRAPTMPRGSALDELTWKELRGVLDEEIGRLPEKFRAPLVLCCLEGRSYEEAARELGCPRSSLAKRLTRARDLLSRQLRQRDIALAASGLAAALAGHSTAATVPALLTINTVKAAARVAAGQTAPAACISRHALILAEEAMQPTFGGKARLVALALAIGLALGGGWTALGALAPEPAAVETAQTPPPAGDKTSPARQDAPALDRFGDTLPAGAAARLGSVRFRHGFNTFALAFASGGKLLASAGVGPGICLWDPSTGQPKLRLPVPVIASAVTFSPDGKWLVAAGRDVWLIEVATGKELRRLKASAKFVDLDTVAFSPDGRTVAAGETKGARAFGDKGSRVLLWDAVTGKELHRLEGHEDVTALAFAPKDGKTLAVGCSDRKVRLWDVAGGKLLRVLEGHDKAIHTLAFAPGGKVLASAGDDGVVWLWEADSGQVLHQLKGHAGEIHDVVFSPDGTVLASAGHGGMIHFWDPQTGKELRRWDAGTGFGGGLAFSPDGKVLASSGGSCIRLWDPTTGKEIQPATGHTGYVRLLRFAADGKTLYSTARDNKLLAWDLATGQDRALGADSLSGTADLSPDAKVLAQSLYGEARIRLVNTATGKEIRSLQPSGKATGDLLFSPDGKLLATSSDDGFRLWDVASGKMLHHVKEAQFSPLALAFSPDGQFLAYGGNDQTLRLLDVATGKEIRRWQRPEDFVRLLAFSPDGAMLLSYGNPGSDLSVWDTATGKQGAQFKGLQRIVALAFAPGGRTLAAVDLARDNFPGPDETAACTLHLLEVASGQEIRRIAMPQASVWSLAFAPDGRTLATGSGDSTILLWDLTARAGIPKLAALTVADLDRLWSELAADAATADRPIAVLARSPKESVPLLGERLRPAVAPAEQLAKLIATLDSKDFAQRDQAFRSLVELGEAAEAVLRKTLEQKLSLEVRQRVEQVLNKLSPANFLRQLRAIDALEEAGTSEARQVLEALAQAAPNPQVAFAAAAAGQRVAQRLAGASSPLPAGERGRGGSRAGAAPPPRAGGGGGGGGPPRGFLTCKGQTPHPQPFSPTGRGEKDPSPPTPLPSGEWGGRPLTPNPSPQRGVGRKTPHPQPLSPAGSGEEELLARLRDAPQRHVRRQLPGVIRLHPHQLPQLGQRLPPVGHEEILAARVAHGVVDLVQHIGFPEDLAQLLGMDGVEVEPLTDALPVRAVERQHVVDQFAARQPVGVGQRRRVVVFLEAILEQLEVGGEILGLLEVVRLARVEDFPLNGDEAQGLGDVAVDRRGVAELDRVRGGSQQQDREPELERMHGSASLPLVDWPSSANAGRAPRPAAPTGGPHEEDRADQRRGTRRPAVNPREPSGEARLPVRQKPHCEALTGVADPKTTVPSEVDCLYPGGWVVLVSRKVQHAAELG